MLGQRHYAINNLLFLSRGLLECLKKKNMYFVLPKETGRYAFAASRSVYIWKHDNSETLETFCNE